MYLIIVGADTLGTKLVELAVQDGHDVAVIEEDEKRAQDLSQQYDVLVLHADPGRGGILEEAGAEKADALVATTGDDSMNLMTLFMAAEHEIKTLVTVVNDKKHEKLFERLGAHILVDPERIVAQHLYNVLQEPFAEDVVTLPGGGHVFELAVSDGSPLIGKTVQEAREKVLDPDSSLIVLLKRDETMSIPSDSSTLAAGDRLTIFSIQPLSDKQRKAFSG